MLWCALAPGPAELPLASVYLTVIPTGSSSSLQWLMKSPIRLNNKCWLLCFLARLSLSCKISGRFPHAWPLSEQHSFRLHGVTCCQMIWFFRNQFGRSSKSTITFVCPCHCYFQRWLIDDCPFMQAIFVWLVICSCSSSSIRLDGNPPRRKQWIAHSYFWRRWTCFFPLQLPMPQKIPALVLIGVWSFSEANVG